MRFNHITLLMNLFNQQTSAKKGYHIKPHGFGTCVKLAVTNSVLTSAEKKLRQHHTVSLLSAHYI